MKKINTKLVEYKINLGTLKSSKQVLNHLKLKSKSVNFSDETKKFIKNYDNATKRLRAANTNFKNAIKTGDSELAKQFKNKKSQLKKLLDKKLQQALGINNKNGKPDYTDKNPLVRYSKKSGTVTIEKRIRKPRGNISGGHGASGDLENRFIDEMSEAEILAVLRDFNATNYFDSFVGRSDDGWIRRVQQALGAENISVQDFMTYLFKFMV